MKSIIRKVFAPFAMVYVIDCREGAAFNYECRAPRFIANHMIRSKRRVYAHRSLWLDYVTDNSDGYLAPEEWDNSLQCVR